VVGWVTRASWPACCDAVARVRRPGDTVVLLYVVDAEVSEVLHGAHAGLLGRGRAADPGAAFDAEEQSDAEEVLRGAAGRLGDADARVLRGRPEREVVAACAGSDVLVAVRDGDVRQLGPRSLGRALRFVVDHAPCDVVLVWPGPAPGVATIPPPPPPGAEPPPPPEPPRA
jgi:nucleotide-binding universal stress UspA family protein